MRNDTPRTFVGATTFAVTEMAYGHCERALVRAISAVDGVQTVTVDVATGVVTVTAATPVDRADIARAVGEAGHTLVP